MPRPQKKRFVCCMPKNECFFPSAGLTGTIFLTVDEYESIRLIDLERNTQEECAAKMRVARSTVQGIYNEARRKIADCLVNGKKLLITGGDYVLCGHGNSCHGKCSSECRRCQCMSENMEEK